MNTSHRIERRPGSKGEGPGVGPGERGGGGKKGNRGTPSGSKGKSSGFSPSMAKLPRSTRNTLLGLRSIKDPFDDDTEQAIKDFHDYLLKASPDEINLEECSLLLQASTKIFGMQVKAGSQHVNSLAAFVTNTAKDDEEKEKTDGELDGKKKRSRKKKDGEGVTAESADAGASSEPSASSSLNPVDGQTAVIVGDQSVANCEPELGASINGSKNGDGVNEVVAEANNNCDSGVTDNGDGSTIVEPSSSQGENSVSQTALSDPSPSGLDSSEATVLSTSGEQSSTMETDNSALNLHDASHLEDGDSTAVTGEQSNAEGTSSAAEDTPVSKRTPVKRGAKEKLEGTPSKKRKLDYGPPPTLISYIDLEDAQSTDTESDDDQPPVLYPEVDLWDGDFDLSADPDREYVQKSSRLIVKELQTLALSPQKQLNSSEDASGEQAIMRSVEALSLGDGVGESVNESSGPSEVVPKGEKENSQESESALKTVESEPGSSAGITSQPSDNSQASGSDPSSSVELPVLTSDDQQEIQNCIYQLHYLPFTCELTKAELGRTFSSTVEHLEKIFKKYNMPFNRNLLKAATVACRDMVSSLSARPSIDMDERQPEQAEAFSQGVVEQSKNPASMINMEKTILERTREKSVAESRKTIQKRLEEMQKLIVPKYIQWPLITENTPEFFQRVKQFEQKMKKVLADEEKKESFDVTKYEIEVLNATALESQEEEALECEGSDESRAVSPRSPCPLDDAKIARMLSPVSVSNGSTLENGRKWVPLSSVFHHMKKATRNECARHFYAVLALLSSQNLDMNYDRHFSQESAALVTKKLDRPQDPQVVSKYPRGVKIMTSRCPDADKEEIYVTALASKSCNESFRDLISNEMHLNGLHDGNHLPNQKRTERVTSNVSSISNGDTHAEFEEEFVPIGPATFTGNLFGGRKNRKK